MHYLRGYRGAVPPMALIAPLAHVTRSTPTVAISGCQLQNVTAARPARHARARWHKAASQRSGIKA